MKQYILKNSDSIPNSKIDFQAELNREQYEVVRGAEGPSLVLAGAGSGKTRTLAYRVAYLLEKGVKPNRIMLVTFTNKAAKEMLNRIEILLKAPPKGLWGGTFHHIGNRLLRIYGQAIGIQPNFNILDEEDAKSLIKSACASVSLPEDKRFPKAEIIKRIVSLSDNLNQPISEIIATRFGQVKSEYASIIEEIGAIYRRKKKQSNTLDFDDLLTEWNRLLLESPAVKEKLCRQFQYILVDEYQDTNPIQGEIVAHLSGEGQNVLVVGDDCQSIYSFRGAEVANILNFPKTFPQAKTFRLEINYRSTPEILNLANESIKNNSNQFDKTLRANRTGGIKPALAALSDNSQQADFICQRILDLERDEGIGLSQIAVLFRAHYQSLELELEFNKRNIPYVMRGGLRFFEQAHIKDTLAYLKILSNFKDEVSWQRALQLQAGIGAATSARLWQKISELSSLEAVLAYPWERELANRALAGWQEVRNQLAKLITIEVNEVARILETILAGGYQTYLKNNFENFQERIDDLEQLAIFASSYDSLEKFLADAALGEGFKGEITMSEVENKNENENEAVTLSTIHQAKGLEWRAVFVIGLTNGQFPNARSFESERELEEERRLFYVAATRAKDQLYLTYPIFGGFDGSIGQVSQFVKELPTDTYEEWRVKGEAGDDEVVYVDDEDDVAANFWQRVIAKRNKL